MYSILLSKDGTPWCLERIMEIIKENRSLSNLLNEKNAEGDTPLHFCATSELLLKFKEFISHPRVDKMAFNKQNLNAWDIASAVKHSSEEVTHHFIRLNFEK
jgi:ankyrin repeat protein